MSQSFSGIIVSPLIGIPRAAKVDLCVPATKPPAFMRIDLNWNTYWQAAGNPTSIGVNVDLTNQGATNPLDLIRSCYIDNTNSSCPIYVQFPDTGFVVTAPPQSAVYMPVMTAQMRCNIYATNLTAGFIPTTTVFLSNVMVPPYVDPALNQSYPQWLGSPLITRSNLLTPGFGPPVLGDQLQSVPISIAGNGATATAGLWNTPLAAGSKVYIKHLEIVAYQIKGQNVGSIWIESTGAAGILIGPISITGPGGGISLPGLTLAEFDGNAPLAGDQTWRVRTLSGSSWDTPLGVNTSYSVQPS